MKTTEEGDVVASDPPNKERKQPTIVFILLPERGAFNASFPLAKHLRSIGYRVVYGGPAGFKDHVRDQAMSYHVISGTPFAEASGNDAVHRSNFAWRWWRTRQIIKYIERETLNYLAQCEEILRLEEPCLVLLDTAIWSYALPPLKLGIPIIGFNTTLVCPFNIRLPPTFSGLLPDCKPPWLTQLRNLTAWSSFLFRIWFSIQLESRVWPLAHGLLPRQSTTSTIKQHGGRFCWSEYGPRLNAPELVVSPVEFDFPRPKEEKGRVYIGSCVDVSRNDGDFDWSGLEPGKALVYCSLGTYSHAYPHSRRLFKAVIDSLSRREGWQAVIQIGDAAEVESFGMMPPQIRLVKEVPQLQLLAHAKVFITHGGLSSVREAIYFGVPMLVFPGWNDQPGNAARIVYHGIGLRGNMTVVDETTMVDMLDRIQEPGFRETISRMQTAFRAQESSQAGIDFIEMFVAGRDCPRAPEIPRQ